MISFLNNKRMHVQNLWGNFTLYNSIILHFHYQPNCMFHYFYFGSFIFKLYYFVCFMGYKLTNFKNFICYLLVKVDILVSFSCDLFMFVKNV